MPEPSRLEDHPLFENLNAEELRELETLMESESFEAGQALIEENGPEDYLYVLTSGTVEVNKEVLPRRSQHLATMEAPTVVGEMGLLAEPRAAATVIAKTAVEARTIPRQALLEKLEAGDEATGKVAYQIGRTLARRMAETDEAVTRIIAQLEKVDPNRELEIFQDRLVQEWTF